MKIVRGGGGGGGAGILYEKCKKGGGGVLPLCNITLLFGENYRNSDCNVDKHDQISF